MGGGDEYFLVRLAFGEIEGGDDVGRVAVELELVNERLRVFQFGFAI